MDNVSEMRQKQGRPKILLILVTACIAILVSVIAAANSFYTEYDRQKWIVLEDTERLSLLFEHEFSIRTHTIKALRRMAEDYLSGKQQLSADLRPFLRPVDGKNGFTLDIPPGYNSKTIGNITGLDVSKITDPDIIAEMDMALSLTSIFRTVIERDPETPWIYYTSENGFMYLFPRVGTDDFFYSEKIQNMDFVTYARPEQNPERRVVWTPLYLDEAGKGYMVTLSTPVYAGDRYMGAISLDISVSRLNWLINRYHVPHSKVFLFASDGTLIVKEDEPPFVPDFTALDESKFSYEQDSTFLSYTKLEDPDWFLAVYASKSEMILQAFLKSLPFLLIAAFLIISIVILNQLFHAYRRVETLSTEDPLTGLWNRRVFDQVLNEELSRAERKQTKFALIFFDVDWFKFLNDMNGHQEGDRVLREISQSVRSVMQRNTDKVFRVGGEEFAVIVLSETDAQLMEIMEMIRHSVAGLGITHPREKNSVVTISLGGVVVDGACEPTFDEAYTHADTALYDAKASGKNCSRLYSGDENRD